MERPPPAQELLQFRAHNNHQSQNAPDAQILDHLFARLTACSALHSPDAPFTFSAPSLSIPDLASKFFDKPRCAFTHAIPPGIRFKAAMIFKIALSPSGYRRKPGRIANMISSR